MLRTPQSFLICSQVEVSVKYLIQFNAIQEKTVDETALTILHLLVLCLLKQLPIAYTKLPDF